MQEQLIHPTEKQVEKLSTSPETQTHLEKKSHHEHKVEHVEKRRPLQELQQNAKEQAVSKEAISIGEKKPEDNRHVMGVQREVKAKAYRHTLQKVRTRLSYPDKVLSKVIHQPTIETASEIGAKTIARPSGILGGGIVALLGSGSILYMSKHYGFKYNFTVFFLLFIAGFVLGMLAETLIRLAAGKRA